MVWTKQKKKIFRRGGKNTQKNNIKKGLNDPNNHNGEVIHLELESCSVKSSGP